MVRPRIYVIFFSFSHGFVVAGLVGGSFFDFYVDGVINVFFVCFSG